MKIILVSLVTVFFSQANAYLKEIKYGSEQGKAKFYFSVFENEGIRHEFTFRIGESPFELKDDDKIIVQKHRSQNLTIDLKFPSLTLKQFRYLNKYFGGWRTQDDYLSGKEYSVADFLPPAMQALMNHHWVPEIKYESGKDPKLLFANCYSTAIALMNVISTQNVSSFPVFNIPWGEGSQFFREPVFKEVFTDKSPREGGRLLSQYLDPDLKQGDLIVFEQRNGRNLVDHVQYVVAVNHSDDSSKRALIVFEKSGAQSFEPYRLKLVTNDTITNISGQFNYRTLRPQYDNNMIAVTEKYMKGASAIRLAKSFSAYTDESSRSTAVNLKLKKNQSGEYKVISWDSVYDQLWNDLENKDGGAVPEAL